MERELGGMSRPLGTVSAVTERWSPGFSTKPSHTSRFLSSKSFIIEDDGEAWRAPCFSEGLVFRKSNEVIYVKILWRK